jgi:hypothetical protein
VSELLCESTSKSTGQRCQQPERWLMCEMGRLPDGTRPDVERRVCQQHGRMLERQGWWFLRELHPVPGFERTSA